MNAAFWLFNESSGGSNPPQLQMLNQTLVYTVVERVRQIYVIGCALFDF